MKFVMIILTTTAVNVNKISQVTNCETKIDNCVGDPCQNNGTCVDGINSFTCSCGGGFSGDICETNVDDCIGVICQNAGTCHDAINNYICNCPCEFSGRNCETRLKNGNYRYVLL